MPPLELRKRKTAQGTFVSGKSEDVLCALQKRKTVFMLLSTLFFAVAIFIPTGGIQNVIKNLTFLYSAVIVYIVGIALSVAVSIFGRKAHKIRKEVTAAEAPAPGFKYFTYLTYEAFVWWRAVMLGFQIAIAVMNVSVLTVLFAVSMGISLALAVVSRQILWAANKDMVFIKAEPSPKDEFYGA